MNTTHKLLSNRRLFGAGFGFVLDDGERVKEFSGEAGADGFIDAVSAGSALRQIEGAEEFVYKRQIAE